MKADARPSGVDTPARAPGVPLLALLVLTVLAFRVAAWISPSRYIPISEALVIPLNVLGVFYLVLGLWVWRLRPSNLTRVYLVYALGGVMHWGGTIGASNAELGLALLLFYVAANAMLDGAFLDLALRYPHDEPRPRWVTPAIYAPALLTLAAVPFVALVPRSAIQSGVGMMLGLAVALSIVGGLVFIAKWLRAGSAERTAYWLSPIVLMLVVTNALSLLADSGVLPGDPQAWNLVYGLEPLVLAGALLRREEREAQTRVP